MEHVSQIRDSMSRNFSRFRESDEKSQLCEHQDTVSERIPEVEWDGSRLTKAREARKLNKNQLAVRMTTDATKIKRWEDSINSPNGEDVARLCMFFGVDVMNFYKAKSSEGLVSDPKSSGGVATREVLVEASRKPARGGAVGSASKRKR